MSENTPYTSVNFNGLPTFKSKWGEIVVLTPSTFPEWQMSCELALTISGVFNNIEGSYRRPGTSANSSGTRPQTRFETTSSQNTSNSVTSGSGTGEKEWVESARQALIILTNSIEGASEHFSGIKSDFSSLKRWSAPRTVQIADGKGIKCEGYGTISFKTDDKEIDLKGVWFVPDFGNMRLLSVWAFNKRGIDVTFVNNKCHVKRDSQLLFEACGEGSKNKVKTKTSSKALQATENNILSQPTESETEWEILHRRLGHINFKDVGILLKSGNTGLKIPLKKQSIPIGDRSCDACLAGKMKEHFNKKTDKREINPLRRVHCDIFGIQLISVRGLRYYLLIVDDATRMCWIKLLKTKEMNEVLSAFKQVKAEAELESGNKIVFIRADNGKSEFGTAFQHYCIEVGIQLEPSPPYKHSMNGVAGRWMGITAVVARSMLYEAQLPHQLWNYAIEHAVFIKNRAPTPALPFSDTDAFKNTPYSAYYGKAADLRNLRVFGCKAYILYPPALNPQKWLPHTRNGNYIMALIPGENAQSASNVPYAADIIERPTSRDALILPTEAQFGSDVPYAANIIERPLSQDASILPTGAQVASNTPNETNIIESSIFLNSLATSRFGRPLRRTSRAAFSHSIATDAIAAQVVHIEEGKLSSIQVPTPPFESITVEQALLEDPKLWKDAIKSELKSLKDANTYIILSGTAPPGKRVVSSKIVLRNKFKSDGSLARRKARIVVRGFEQQYGIDYFETFASVIRYNTLR
ncbi:hypothetical protein K3495_g11988, partial [Podosphaera aphanis]